ncbi:interferon-inducible GTPase 5-like [Zootoca vivipara]|uniref:interferon-inducible GTPase 5-like n=1 Tax=Zootoca vivipara TaxID=8524 RepID=UPI0015922524|nr:interferon-inducible GTPase 5-like [Zootoca vivipara]XP_060131633.1 interferon-inducible GTPase 5-like [Zootoca vivipara]XP_060131635.1 interferon-inducible GTPase 5-like [Zootoca vivipara]
MDPAITIETLKKDLAEMKAAFEKKTFEAVSAEVQQQSNLLNNITLEIAITGRSGVGKSSFVNALRGMEDYAEGAAKTGVTETTMVPQEYSHPTFPKVKFWDLPGFGKDNFSAEEYLEEVNFSKYDFFIIIASGRFTEDDTNLALEIQKNKKKFYYVRSKVDVDIDNDRKSKGIKEGDSDRKMQSEKETLDTVRTDSYDNLKALGVSSPRVFLISRWDLSKYDFPLLQETIEKEQDELKRDVLIMCLPIFTKDSIKKKKAAMESLIWKNAMVSCTVGLIPVPFLSFGCDIAIVVSTMRDICKVFGLDENSLNILANRVEKDVEELKSVIEHTPSTGKITAEFVMDILKRSAMWGAITAVEMVLGFIPLLGSLYGGGSSFATTFYLLNNFLEKAVKDAEKVLAKAAEPKRHK